MAVKISGVHTCREVSTVPTMKWVLCKCQSDDDDECYCLCGPFTDTFLTSVSSWWNTSYPPSLVFSQICPFYKVFFHSIQPDIFFPFSELSCAPLSFGTKSFSCSHPILTATTQIPKQTMNPLNVKTTALLTFVSLPGSPMITCKILKCPFSGQFKCN